ncbi:TolC family protein [Aequorivita echinoideorum]|uniref:TolC family protein n=1 Tax=Aequorivita echinoideorum TaxID=1549647 RepID=A0ABS5S3B7_9FLAO|nr:TolC family protein [Aequorivita echinoideorum]MBT0607697.1 TolC family protein [Aequorivita echinoideorum]
MKKLSILFFFLTIGFSVTAQDKLWTLEEAVTRALEENISVKQAQLDLELAEIDKLTAFGNYLPAFNISGVNSWNTGLTQNVTTGVLQNQTTRNFSANATLGITIFNGLNNLRQAQRAKLSRLAAQYNLDQIKDNTALFVANAYLEILFNKENLNVIKAQHQITLEQLERSNQLVDAGSIPRGDLLEIQSTSANEEQRIVVAENTIRISLINLAQILLIKDYENFDIAETSYDAPLSDITNNSPEQIIAKAKEERQEIKIANANIDLAEKDVQISRSNYYPTLSGFLNYNTRESGADRILQGGVDPDQPTQVIGQVEATGQTVVAPNFGLVTAPPTPFFDQLYLNDGISYGLQLNIPVLNGFSTRASVQRNKINVKRAEFEKEQAELELESNVYQAYTDVVGARKAYEAAMVAVEAQEQAYQYSTDRFDVGLLNSFDFSQAKFRLENAQSEALRAKYDYIFKIKVLELYFGIPATELKF